MESNGKEKETSKDKNTKSYCIDEIEKVKYHNAPLVVTIVYGVFGASWLLISDKLLDFLAENSTMYKQLQTCKSWIYVLITTILMYAITQKRMKDVENNAKKTIEAYTQLKIAHEELINYEENFRRIAFYDTLTELPNRIMFENEISKFINQKTEKNKFAIVYINIDNFKYINDTLGYQVGDEFLKYMGEKLNTEIKAPNLVARLNGDEFAIVFIGIQTDELLMEKVEEIKKSIGRIWSINNHQFFISMSIGVAIFPDDGNNIDELLKNADIAMHAAKRGGKNKTIFYKKDIQRNNLEHIQMANKLQSGIENEEFILFYQPQFKLDTGEIVGMEALVRWVHPKEGFISPMEFIPVAEETGQIYNIERCIIKNALTQRKRWEEEGFSHIELSINLSGKTLTSDINFQELEILLSTFDVDYSKIIIEITETAIISNVDLVTQRLNRLKEKGFKIALDDFGTGYSSLTYLKRFPIDIIKLDRSFINLIPQNSIDNVIIKHILSLAHDLKYEVVAEGIETTEQLEYLKKHYCESGQGYLLSKPLPEENVSKLLKDI